MFSSINHSNIVRYSTPAEINSLSLPLTEDQLAALIDELTEALRDVNLVNTDLEVSLPDRRRLASLLDRFSSVHLPQDLLRL